MKVFKFGGASVKDAAGVKNVATIIKNYTGGNAVIVVSAMGKTTNALEQIVNLGYAENDYNEAINQLYKHHQTIIDDLQIHVELSYFIDLIIQQIEGNRHMTYPQYYDQVVSVGELISSSILSAYLSQQNIANTWMDARTLIATDNTWRTGVVNWEKTTQQIAETVPAALQTAHVVTQGFIAGNQQNTTTLGREGSDYTGAIFANILLGEGLWIWKDVPAVLNADPKLYPDAIEIPELTYYEATEITYYGASVIHPKTIHPLEQKSIPLFVKSFINPELPGTVIQTNDKVIDYPPITMEKPNQTLISIIPSKVSFVDDEQMAIIYDVFIKHKLSINIIQKAAQSVSVVVDDNDDVTRLIKDELKLIFSQGEVRSNNNLKLITIRNYIVTKAMKSFANGQTPYLEQVTRKTMQVLL